MQEIRKKYKEDQTSYRKLGKEYKVDYSTIGGIIKNKWFVE